MKRKEKWTLVRYAAELLDNCQLPYQSSFSANCTCRDVVEVLVIAPPVPDNPLGFGCGRRREHDQIGRV